MYKFSRDVTFADDQNPAVLFLRIICYLSLSSICIVIAYKNFKDLVFVDDKLPTKTAKNMSLENTYVRIWYMAHTYTRHT